jgi:IS5 family transposase
MTKAAEKPVLPSTPFLASYHELFKAEDLWAAARKLGAVERERKIDVAALVEATVLAMSGLPGTQTSAFANYIQLTGKAVAPSAFYDRFTDPFTDLMADVSRRAIAAVRAVAPDDSEALAFAALLKHFGDVQVADSTCQVLKRLAAHWAPSTNPERPASFKLHAIVSLKDGLPVEQHVSPQRDHDSPQLADGALTAGTLFLADLGYVDHARLIRLKRRGVQLLMRLKKGQNPRIRRVRTGRGSRRACQGMTLDEALATGALDFDHGQLDVDVIVSANIDGMVTEEVVRVVGLAHPDAPDGDWYYMTTVPHDILSVHEVSLTYTLRWDIELLWKHLKTGVGLAAIRAWRHSAVIALVHAKITGVALGRLLELAAKPALQNHAMGQLAIILALNRSIPMILSLRMRGQNIDLAEMERRILLVTTTIAKSRNRRRDRARSAKRAVLATPS